MMLLSWLGDVDAVLSVVFFMGNHIITVYSS